MITRPAKPGGFEPGQLRDLMGEAIKKDCSENNCCLGLRGLSNCTILKGEIVLPDKKACDCIIFHNEAS